MQLARSMSATKCDKVKTVRIHVGTSHFVAPRPTQVETGRLTATSGTRTQNLMPVCRRACFIYQKRSYGMYLYL
jgi:hypothetical protein